MNTPEEIPDSRGGYIGEALNEPDLSIRPVIAWAAIKKPTRKNTQPKIDVTDIYPTRLKRSELPETHYQIKVRIEPV